MLSALAVMAAIRTMKKMAQKVEARLMLMEKIITGLKKVMPIVTIDPREAEANPMRMEKASTGLKKVMPIATIDPREAEANPMLMGKAVMAIKEHPPMEGMETTARAPLNMLCIINTNWV